MWHGIADHDEIVERFRRTLASGRLASTYLFVGPPGVGKRRFALELARCLLCLRTAASELDACGECDSCRLFAAGNHPDLEVVGRPPDKSELPISLFVGDDQHRNQDGLCQRLALRPYLGNRRVAIIDDADYFNAASANCLLKTLEEPPPRSLLIMIGTSPARQLPTIRSRAQIVRFQPLSAETVAQALVDTGVTTTREEAARIAGLSEGSIQQAVELADSTLREFRDLVAKALSADTVDGLRLARAVQAFVDEAGKEAPAKRDRLRSVIAFAVEHYRVQLRRIAEQTRQNEAAEAGSARPRRADRGEEVDRTLRALDACFDATEQVDRNANLGLVIQNWCEELEGRSAACR